MFRVKVQWFNLLDNFMFSNHYIRFQAIHVSWYNTANDIPPSLFLVSNSFLRLTLSLWEASSEVKCITVI